MKAPFKWESICTTEGYSTMRAKVEGGWLVNHFVYPHFETSQMRLTTTFVPDPQHKWEVETNEPTSDTPQTV